MPLVSVIVPVYKVEAELPRCVESLLSQSMGDIEVILVDDGSPDGCPVMCDEYARRDARVRVVHKENGGLSDARNAGLDVASGEYVMFVDSDDYIEPDSCEVLLAAAREHGSDLVVGDWHDVPDKGRVHYTNLEEGRVYTGRDFVLASLKRNEWYPCACFLLYSKKHLDVHGCVVSGLWFRSHWASSRGYGNAASALPISSADRGCQILLLQLHPARGHHHDLCKQRAPRARHGRYSGKMARLLRENRGC